MQCARCSKRRWPWCARSASMIDPTREELLGLERARLLCTWKGPGGVSFATIWRWTKAGFRGVVLETLETPSGMATSREAIARFVQAINNQVRPNQPQSEAVA